MDGILVVGHPIQQCLEAHRKSGLAHTFVCCFAAVLFTASQLSSRTLTLVTARIHPAAFQGVVKRSVFLQPPRFS